LPYDLQPRLLEVLLGRTTGKSTGVYVLYSDFRLTQFVRKCENLRVAPNTLMAVVDKKGDQASVVGGSGLPDFLHEDYFYRLADGRVYYGLAESYIYE
jgi:hypothetical protein